MIDLQATYGGPAIHKTERLNPTEVIVRLIEENPGASRDVLEKLFISEIEDDPDYRTPVIKYFFINAWSGLHPLARRKVSKREIEQRIAEERQAVEKDVQRLKRAVILSELVMPNNKKVADCTGTEMMKFGKWHAAVGKIVKRRKVGAVLTEEQLYEIWRKQK